MFLFYFTISTFFLAWASEDAGLNLQEMSAKAEAEAARLAETFSTAETQEESELVESIHAQEQAVLLAAGVATETSPEDVKAVLQEVEAETEADVVAALESSAEAENTPAPAPAPAKASQPIKMDAMKNADSLKFKGADENKDKILAQCNGCRRVKGKYPAKGKTPNGFDCECKAAREARRRLRVRAVARTAAKNTTRKLVKQLAPKLFKRVVTAADMAKVKADLTDEAFDTLRKNATGEHLTPIAVQNLAKEEGQKAAERVVLKAGVATLAQSNNKNARVHLSTAKRIIKQAIEAGVEAGEKIAQAPIDSYPKKKKAKTAAKPAAAKPAAAPATPAAPALTEMEAEAEAETETETEVEGEDAPAAGQPPAPPANPQPNAGISEDQRNTMIQQWITLAAAAPADQKLWEVYTDQAGAQYYFNTVTRETTWKAPEPLDALKRARDFNAETDLPASFQKWQNNFITALAPGATPARDWCSPYLCKNGRPCVKGTCQCGLMWEGHMCETPSKLAVELRFKEVQAAGVHSFAEIERRKKVEAEEKAAAEEMQARNKTTGFMPITAEVNAASFSDASVLGPDGKVNRLDIDGPELTDRLMPDTMGPADKAMAFYGRPEHIELLNTQPAQLAQAVDTNHHAFVRAAATQKVFASTKSGLPNVQERMVKAYTKPAPVERNPIYAQIKAFEIPNPPANAPTTYQISSLE